jgi:hypothetical protein
MHELMNESAPINLTQIKQGIVGKPSKVQASNSIQNISNIEEHNAKLKLIDNFNAAYNNTLGNTLTKVIQQMSSATNAYSLAPEKIAKSTQNKNYRIDKNQIFMF